MKYFTGVGSRSTPKNILELMEKFAHKASKERWVLRSGGADGADSAFQKGATESPLVFDPEIYIPWKGFNGWEVADRGIMIPKLGSHWGEAVELAKQFHPAWDNCSDGAKALHTRNIFQVMGRDLKTPSSFLLCYSVPKGNSISGGTRTAWEYAKDRGIPCYNLFHEDVQERIFKYVGE